MQWLRVKSDYVVLIGEYPFHKQLKEEIVPILEQYPDIQEKKTNVKATMTEWDWNPGSDRIERLNHELGILNKERKPIINKQARMIISFFSSIMVELLMHTSVHIKAIDKENYGDNYNSTVY